MARNRNGMIAGLVLLNAIGLDAVPAAAIVCDGPYQVVGGSSIATPYCQDNYLAQVARGYGVRVSDAEIRNNPGTKGRLCRFIGHDNRVSSICGDQTLRRREAN